MVYILKDSLHSKMCFSSCFYSWMFELLCAEWCICRVWHYKAVFTFICWKWKVSLCSLKIWVYNVYLQEWFVTSQLVWSQLWSSIQLTQVWCGNFSELHSAVADEIADKTIHADIGLTVKRILAPSCGDECTKTCIYNAGWTTVFWCLQKYWNYLQ